MKKIVVTILLLFTLAATPQSDISDTVDVVERVSKWNIEQATIYGVLCVIVGGLLIVTYRQSNYIKVLNEEVKDCERQAKKDEVGQVERLLDKYTDLAIKQSVSSERTYEILKEIKDGDK